MAKLVKTPDSVKSAFIDGMVKALLLLFILPFILVVRTDSWSAPWAALAFGAVIVVAAALVSGAVFAGRALMYKWIYERVTDDPPDFS